MPLFVQAVGSVTIEAFKERIVISDHEDSIVVEGYKDAERVLAALQRATEYVRE